MPLTIRYTDTRHTHEVLCDEIQSTCIVGIVKKYMLHPTHFDFMHIDLRDESIEEVSCWNRAAGNAHAVCQFGGAIAWNIYRQTAEIWPEIKYHTSGRPAVII